LRLDQVKQCACEREHGKGTHPARGGALLALIDLLESKPEERRQAEHEGEPA